MIAYPDLARTALVLGSQGDLLAENSECQMARALAHIFNARRFLDIRYDLAQMHMQKVLEVLGVGLFDVFGLQQWQMIALIAHVFLSELVMSFLFLKDATCIAPGSI